MKVPVKAKINFTMKSLQQSIQPFFKGKAGFIFDMILLFIFAVLFLLGIGMLRYPVRLGLQATYYEQPDWSGSPLNNFRDREISLRQFRNKFPELSRMYSARWEGVLFIDKPGIYYFSTFSDDGSDLWIAGQMVVDNRGLHGMQERSGKIYLEQGFHDIRIHYMQQGGGAAFKTSWKPPNQNIESLSHAPLFPAVPSQMEFRMYRLTMYLVTGLKGLSVAGLLFLITFGTVMGYSRLPSMSTAWIVFWIMFGIMISHFFLSPITTSFDSKWTIHTTMSLIREGNTDLDEYSRVVERYRDYTIEEIDGHLYTIYPTGTSLLVSPIVFLVDKGMEWIVGINFEETINTEYMIPKGLERFTASCLVACTAAIVYLTAVLLNPNRQYALLLTFIVSFCTSAWSTASRALWQHGPTMLLLALTLYLLLLAQERPCYAPWCIRLISIPLVFSYLVRPTNSLSIAVFSFFIALRYRKHVLSYCLWSLTILLPFLFFNYQTYHTLLPPYYLPQGQLSNRGLQYLEALNGMLFSPSRGLFVFSPILIFALYGVILKIRQRTIRLIDYCLLSVIILHWMASAAHLHWWGGYSYGPRYFTDVLPYFAYFLIPVFPSIASYSGKRKVIVVTLFICCIITSFMIHYRGSHSEAVYNWNASPVSVDLDPSRVWNLHDIQFLRGL